MRVAKAPAIGKNDLKARRATSLTPSVVTATPLSAFVLVVVDDNTTAASSSKEKTSLVQDECLEKIFSFCKLKV